MPPKSSGPSGLCAGRMTKRPAKRPVELLERVAQRGGLERGQLLAGAAAQIAAARAQLVRARRPAARRRPGSPVLRRRRRLPRAAAQSRPGRSQRRCVSPRQGPSGANEGRCGSAASGTASAASMASSTWSRAVPARSNASICRLPCRRLRGPAAERRLRLARPDRGRHAREEARTQANVSSANTRSRCASRSWTVTSSSRKPGCPRLSASSSRYRRPSSVRGGVGTGAAPRIRCHSSLAQRFGKARRRQRAAEQAADNPQRDRRLGGPRTAPSSTCGAAQRRRARRRAPRGARAAG